MTRDSIVRASWWGTAVFGATAVAGAAAPHPLAPVALVIAAAMFVVGCVLLLRSLVLAAARSRTDEIAVSNLYLLSGAPAAVRARLFGSLAVEVIVAFGTAAARPYTIAATAILAPLYGLGLCGLWAARYGTFPPRRPTPKRR